MYVWVYKDKMFVGNKFLHLVCLVLVKLVLASGAYSLAPRNAFEAAIDKDYEKVVEFINDDNFYPNTLYNPETGEEAESGYTLLGSGIISNFDSDQICNLIDLLHEKRADLNLQDCQGDTPLHHAIRNSYINVAKKLINLGAIKFIKNNYENSPFNEAAARGIEFYSEIFGYSEGFQLFFDSYNRHNAGQIGYFEDYGNERNNAERVNDGGFVPYEDEKDRLARLIVTGLSAIAGGALFYSLYNYPKIAKLIGSLEIALFNYNVCTFYRFQEYFMISFFSGALLGGMFIRESLKSRILLSIFGAMTSGLCGCSFIFEHANIYEQDSILIAEALGSGLILAKNIFVFVYRLNRILSQFEKLEKLLV